MQNFQTSIQLLDHLQPVDWLVLLIAGIITITATIYGHRQQNRANTAEYLLMSRQLTLPLFVATLVTAWYGGVIGVTQIAFEQGIYNFVTQGLFWYITYIIFAVYLVKKIRTYDTHTLPELVKKIYGKESAKLTAGFIFLKTLPISYAIALGLLLQLLVPWPLFVTTAIGVGLITLYVASGGLRTIVYSSTIQFGLMCAGLLAVLVFSCSNFGGLGFLRANLPAQHFSICGSHTLATTLVWFFIACAATFINPAFYQRCFAANSTRTATIGILISTAIWFMFDICTTFGAMYACAVIPKANSAHAYITYSMQLLPAGWRGLFIASMLATIISTLDSFLFISANILQFDLKFFKQRRAYQAVIIAAILTIVLSLLFDGRIEKVWFVVKSYFSACLLLPIMFGYFIPRLANDRVFYTSGILSAAGMTVCEIYWKNHIDSFYIGCGISILVFASYAILKPMLLHSSNTQNDTNRTQTAEDLR